ncbi:MAG: hypothetical protein WB524_14030 [Acidobacteriaceae bacterium]|jgi:hypothetical protein
MNALERGTLIRGSWHNPHPQGHPDNTLLLAAQRSLTAAQHTSTQTHHPRGIREEKNERYAKLHDLGQSLWLDNITRGLLMKGTLRRYIQDFSVTGLTSNPTIFDHALRSSHEYDHGIRNFRSPTTLQLSSVPHFKPGKPAQDLSTLRHVIL